jgi:hypothetical protein
MSCSLQAYHTLSPLQLVPMHSLYVNTVNDNVVDVRHGGRAAMSSMSSSSQAGGVGAT